MAVSGGQQHDVTSEVGLLAFYDAAFDGVYRFAARLTWGDWSVTDDCLIES